MNQPRKRMTFYRKQSIIFTLFAIPQTILYVMFFIAPIIGGIVYSFTDYNGISKEIHFVGFNNYKTVFSTTANFLKAWSFYEPDRHNGSCVCSNIQSLSYS